MCMTDMMNKVTKGLEQCISSDKTCKGCPYEFTVCTTILNSDALFLLKEQQKLIDEITQRRANNGAFD